MSLIKIALRWLSKLIQNPKVLLALFGVVLIWHVLSQIKSAAYDAGFNAATAQYLELQVKQAQEFEKERQRLEKELLAVQKKLNEKAVVINTDTHEKLEKQDESTKAIIDSLRADNKRLSISVKRLSAAKATAELSASVAGDYATSRAELSKDSAEFLVRLAGDADRTAIRLQGCQAHIKLLQSSIDEYNAKK